MTTGPRPTRIKAVPLSAPEVVPPPKAPRVAPAPKSVPQRIGRTLRRLRKSRRLRFVRRWRHRAMPILAAAAALAVIIPLGLWVHYRAVHVVSRNASIKGSIANMGTQLDGVVTSVEVEVGQQVKAGQVIARFEDHQLQAAVQRAQSQLDKAERQLEVETMAISQEARRLGSRVTEASARAAAAKSQVTAAQSQADEAKSRYELRQSLAKGGVITQEELRAADAARRTAEAVGETARADQKAAEAARQLAQIESDGLTVRERNIVVLESEVAACRAELSLAQADLAAAVIRAPADGWVVQRIAEPGAAVVVGQPIAALWIGNDVWCEAWIDEEDLGKVAVGNQARVTVKSHPGRVFTGRVETIGVSTDFELPDTAVPQPRHARMRTTPVVCVRVRLDESEGLLPGLSAVAGIHKKKKAQ
jgi:multidrug resistance efflux pump